MILTVNKLTHKDLIRTALRKTIFANNPYDRRPCPVAFYGETGAGKSSLALFWAETLGEMLLGSKNGDLLSWMKHVIEEHVAYTVNEASDVLEHAVECSRAPVAIFMEAREAFESRRSMSSANLALTRAVAISRRLNPMLLVYCLQKLNEIDVRARMWLKLVGKISKFIDYTGRTHGPVVRYFVVKRRIVENMEEKIIFEPATIVYKNNEFFCGGVKWRLPKGFDYFIEFDKNKKKEIVERIENRDTRSKKRKEEVDESLENVLESVLTETNERGREIEIQKPNKDKDKKEEWIKLVKEFLADCVEFDPEAYVPSSKLYGVYVEYSKRTGKTILKQHEFGHVMRHKIDGVTDGVKRVNGKATRVLLGIRLKDV